MATNTLKRPALGQMAALGMLYDARGDSFLPLSVLRGPPPESVIVRTDVSLSDTKYSSNNTYKEKFNKMGINTDLSASILAGMVDVAGCGHYLTEPPCSQPTVHQSLHCTITTVHEKLNFTSPEMRDWVDLDKLGSGLATHVVAEISWGAQSIVAARRQLVNGEDRAQIEASLTAAVHRLGRITTPGKAEPVGCNGQQTTNISFEVAVYQDVLGRNDIGPQDFDSAYNFFVNLPRYVWALNEGRGTPLTYTLLPIGFFSYLFAVEIPTNTTIRHLSTECQEKCVNLLDEFRSAQQTLNAYDRNLADHNFCVPKDHLRIVADRIRNSTTAEANLKDTYARLVKDIRIGKADNQQVYHLLEDFLRGDSAPQRLIALTHEYAGKLEFVDRATREGADYIGYNGQLLEAALRTSQYPDVYVFYFNDQVMKKKESWNDSLTLLLDTLHKRGHNALILVVDCDATGQKLEKAYMSHSNNGRVITKDLLEQQKLLSDKCVIRYDKHDLDKSVTTSPSQRRPVRIPCPGPGCNSFKLQDWICFRCHSPVEYGMVDNFIYCDCGRSKYDKYDFQCKDPQHGPMFEKYEKKMLLRLLENLEPPTELNVLIMGETGVGKSTFINAFVNYLTFSSLDEGLSAEKLNWTIPCSFSTQHVESGGRLVQEEVRIGSEEDERDGSKGQSATQKTTAHSLYVGNILVRLIDTPGIGDTRGTQQDAKNMLDLLSVLRNYDKLHGILILLKPNNSRLTVMFRFCIKELLTHLHRSAAVNMVFGFTNTRGTNYQPGDTFQPLQTLLSEYKDVIPGLFRHNVYCFDSESFRYLAARKKGIDMGNLEDYRRSWQHSGEEAQRLLAHFRELQPHNTKNTLSLNETRYLIAQMTAPMAQISKSITKSIADNEADTKALSDANISGAALRSRLNLKKTTLDARQLSKPRTVCSNPACIEVRDGEGSNGEKVIIRKSLCHNPCCLTDVPPNSIGAKELSRCAAMNNDKCHVCSHHRLEHLHVVVEYQEKSVTVKDPKVEEELNKNGSVVQLKSTAIAAKQKLIAELKNEHRQIQEASAQFSIYLKNNGITHYNDATLEYLDHLIKEEKSKGNAKRLGDLELDRKQYSEFVDAMTQSMASARGYRPLDANGVYQLVQKLYSLPHSGNDLRNVAKVVGTAYAATFREKPYRVRGKNYWMNASFHETPNRNSTMLMPIRGISRSEVSKPGKMNVLMKPARHEMNPLLETRLSKPVANPFLDGVMSPPSPPPQYDFHSPAEPRSSRRSNRYPPPSSGYGNSGSGYGGYGDSSNVYGGYDRIGNAGNRHDEKGLERSKSRWGSALKQAASKLRGPKVG